MTKVKDARPGPLDTESATMNSSPSRPLSTTPNPNLSLTATVTLTTAALALLLPTATQAQYSPPTPAKPFPGFLNEYLRQQDPANSAWDIRGFARVRYEVHDGNGIPTIPGSLDFRAKNTDNHNAYVLELLRARIAYTDSWWSAHLEGRSSLAQGDERFAFAGNPRSKEDGPEADTIDLHQAFLTLGNPKEFPLTLKVGRQELSYADERLIGSFIWNNLNRVFDGAKLHWDHEWAAVDLFTARPVIPEQDVFNVSNDYESFSGIYATSSKIPKHSLDVFALARNVSAGSPQAVPQPQTALPSARDIYTVGVNLRSKPGELGSWDYFVNAFGQFGNFRDLRAGAPTRRLEHQAFAFVLNGGYTFTNAPAKPRLALEYAFGSGDDDPNDNQHGTFDNLYPTNHKFYGYADFASLQNLHDLRPMLQFKPIPRMNVALEGHIFWLADTSDSFYSVGGVPRGGISSTPGTGYGINPGYGNFLGTEIDLVAGYNVTRYATLEAGYCHFFPGSYIDSSLSNPAFGSRDADFLYLQVMVNF